MSTSKQKTLLDIFFAIAMTLCTFMMISAVCTDEASAADKTVHVYTAGGFYNAVNDNAKKTIYIDNDITIGTTYIGSNKTIIAKGRTINCPAEALRNSASKLNYKSINNVKIIGGKWKSNCRNSLFQFVHASGITMENMTITCGITGHAIELIACKDVTIKNCKITGKGKCSKSCVEEMIQIDVATPRTAPTVKSRYGSKYTKGQICKNITIDKCIVTGARGICANFARSEKRFINNFHENITVSNCKVTGKTAEALAMFNAMKVNVKNNTLKSKSSRTGTAYSIGLHVHIFGNNKNVEKADRTVFLSGNTAYGGRQAIQIWSHTSSKFKSAVVKNNKAHCKKGKSNAIKIGGVSNKKVSGNKTYKW